MTPEKQQKTSGVLMALVVILLLGAQYGMQYLFRQSYNELVSVSTSLEADKRKLMSKRSLSERFERFRTALGESAGGDRQFPASGNELFTALRNILKDYGIDFQNNKENIGVKPGALFTLEGSFSGQYYNLLRALAAIRESGYIMRISQITIKAGGGGNVEGSISIISTARAQS